MTRSMTLLTTLLMTLAMTLSLAFATIKAFAETQTINVVALEVNDTKIWIPSVILAKKGDTVKIHAINKIPGQNKVHGFAIDQFKIQALVMTDKPTDLEFVANKAGIFPIRCHLHPAHVGGQLLVTE